MPDAVTDPVAALRARERVLLGRLREVRAMLALLTGTQPAAAGPRPSPADDSPGKSPAPVARADGEPGRAVRDPSGATALGVARWVAAHGPAQVSVICRAMGIDTLRWEATKLVARNPYLEKAGPGIRDPYRLSEAGRRATAEPSTATP